MGQSSSGLVRDAQRGSISWWLRAQALESPAAVTLGKLCLGSPHLQRGHSGNAHSQGGCAHGARSACAPTGTASPVLRAGVCSDQRVPLFIIKSFNHHPNSSACKARVTASGP